MGADDGATSHFNFFKHYRPDVVGGSTGAHFWQLPGMVRGLSLSLPLYSLTLLSSPYVLHCSPTATATTSMLLLATRHQVT